MKLQSDHIFHVNGRDFSLRDSRLYVLFVALPKLVPQHRSWLFQKEMALQSDPNWWHVCRGYQHPGTRLDHCPQPRQGEGHWVFLNIHCSSNGRIESVSP